jgi:hypothetical protein
MPTQETGKVKEWVRDRRHNEYRHECMVLPELDDSLFEPRHWIVCFRHIDHRLFLLNFLRVTLVVVR